MRRRHSTVLPLPPFWVLLDAAHSKLAGMELRRELPLGHALESHACLAVARRLDSDDYLFKIDGSDVHAQVHLTFHAEHRAEWPMTRLYACFTDWAAKAAPL